jgi:colanic acid biosynthesis glycosyl transferase WcaI
MSSKFLVLGINFYPELVGIGKYTGEMVDWLARNGYQCTVVTAFPYYPHWKIQSPYNGHFYKKEVLNDESICVYRCPLYVPAKPTGVKRVLHDASFSVSSLLMIVYLLFKPKHDYIFCPAPPFQLGLLAIFYRFLKGGKLIYHVQDLQIDAASELGLIKSLWLIRALLRLEQFILNRADVISTISTGMFRKIKRKTEKSVQLLPNWVDVDQFSPLDNSEALRKEWGFSASDKIILYSGSIGEKQGFEDLLSVAEKLKENSSVKFLIAGSGPYKENLESDVISAGLTNIEFYPLQPLDKLNEFLNIADVHLVIQKPGAADLVMPSKLTTILAVGGLAVVTAEPGTSLYECIHEFNMGIICEPGNPLALLKSIEWALSGDHREIRSNGRKYAETYLSQNEVISRFMSNLIKHDPSVRSVNN